MKDAMTPKERMKAIAEGRPYDRIPHGFGVGDAASKVTGVKVSAYHTDPKTRIAADVAAYREYGLDGLGNFFRVSDVFDVKTHYPDYSTPYIENTIKLSRDDLKKTFVEDPKNDPRLQVFWQVLDGLLEEVGDEVGIGVACEGPLTATGRIIGVDNILKSLVRDPDYAHAVIGKVTEAEIAIIESLKGYEVGFMTMDPVSSGSLISRAHYLEFAQPYQRKLFEAMERVSGSKPMLHICGNTAKILKDMAETNAGMLSIDNILDLEFVKKEVGDIIPITGNVKPSETMLLGTPEDVVADLKECLRKGWDSPAGYVPSFGCGLPIDTPMENLYTLFDAVREYGKYPLNPELFR
jgi:uroporphyrinogen decarboxylase